MDRRGAAGDAGSPAELMRSGAGGEIRFGGPPGLEAAAQDLRRAVQDIDARLDRLAQSRRLVDHVDDVSWIGNTGENEVVVVAGGGVEVAALAGEREGR